MFFLEWGYLWEGAAQITSSDSLDHRERTDHEAPLGISKDMCGMLYKFTLVRGFGCPDKVILHGAKEFVVFKQFHLGFRYRVQRPNFSNLNIFTLKFGSFYFS